MPSADDVYDWCGSAGPISGSPVRQGILHGDIPPRPEPLPKFLNDQDAAKPMAAARAHQLPRYRIVVGMLARTGLRAASCATSPPTPSPASATPTGCGVPLLTGKLRNDRFIPLHPDLVVLKAEWTATNAEHIRTQRRLIADHHAPINRAPCIASSPPQLARPASATSIPTSCATLATQAINRGMRLEDEGRASRIGQPLECRLCDAQGVKLERPSDACISCGRISGHPRRRNDDRGAAGETTIGVARRAWAMTGSFFSLKVIVAPPLQTAVKRVQVAVGTGQ